MTDQKTYFSTRGMPRSKSISAWDEAIAEHFGKFVTQPGSKPFDARFDLSRVGNLIAIRSSHNAKSSHRGLHEIRAAKAKNYFVIFQLHGSCKIIQGSHQASLLQGDVILLDSRLPCRFDYGGQTAQVTLFVPCALLDARGIAHREMLAVALRGAPAVMLGSMLRVGFGSSHSWTDLQGSAIADALINFIAATWSMRDQSEISVNIPAIPAIVQSIQSHIVSHLGSADLTPTSIAAAYDISVRHLHRLFETTGTTLSYWIRRCRLDRCAIDLLDESQISKNITDICFRWGFGDSAHFSRVFKAEFGLSPGEYRRLRMEIR